MAAESGGAGKVPKVFTERAKAAKAAMDAQLSMLEAQTKAHLTLQKAKVKQAQAKLQFTGGQLDMAAQARRDRAAASQENPVGPEINVMPYPDASQPSQGLAGAQGTGIADILTQPGAVQGGAGIQAATGGLGREAPPGINPAQLQAQVAPYNVSQQTTTGGEPVRVEGGVDIVPTSRTTTRIDPNNLSPAELGQLILRERALRETEQRSKIANDLAERRLAISAQNAQTALERLEVSKQNSEIAAANVSINAARLHQQKELHKLTHKRLLNQFDTKIVKNYQDNYNTSIAKLRERQLNLATAQDILNEAKAGNQVAPELLRIAISRLGGEVGALSDRDRARLEGGRAWATRAAQFLEQAQTGKLTEENATYFQGVIDTFKGSIDGVRKQRAEFFTDQLVNARGGDGEPIVKDREQAGRLIDPDFFTAKTKAEKIEAPSIPEGLPEGSTLLETSPDGVQIWQAPDGRKARVTP